MTEYRKLVRDRVPEIITADGRRPVVTVLAPPERRPALIAKLAEEAAEAAAASDDHLPEELADIVEVVRALARDLGMSLEQVLALADAKRERRGGFDQGVFLVREEPGEPVLEDPVTTLTDERGRRPFDQAPDQQGWYAVWLDAEGAAALSDHCGEVVSPGIIYAGECRTQTIRRHLAHNDIGSFTLLKNVAALMAGQKQWRATNRGGRLKEPGRSELLAWRDSHLSATWTAATHDLSFAALLATLDPPLRLHGWGADATVLRQAITAGRARLDSQP